MKVTNQLPHFTRYFLAFLAGVWFFGQGVSLVAAATPQLNRISPTRVNAGTDNVTVTLAGNSFAADNEVFINDLPVAAQMSGGAITVTVPNSLTAQPGILYFVVKSVDGFASDPRALLVLDPASINPQNAAITNSASYSLATAPGSMATIFGTHLATGSELAAGLPLPIQLTGTSVFINGSAVPLIYAGGDVNTGASQVNFIMPEDVAAGTTEVLVFAGNGVVTLGTVEVSDAVPGVFTMNQSGRGLPIALTTADGVNFASVANLDGTPRTISAGTPDQPTYLILFGTGWHRRTDLGNVSVSIGGVAASVAYAGSQPDFFGLDQMNVIIPSILAGLGQAEIIINVDGREANRTVITIQ